MKINIKRIEEILGFEIPLESKKQYEEFDLTYEKLTESEFMDYLTDVVKVLMSDITKSGSHRFEEWENGWEGNLNSFVETGNVLDLIPKYHSKRSYVRWDGNIIKPNNKKFDYLIHTIFVDSILHKYCENVDNVFEFGCGSGYHLIRNSEKYKNKQFYGLDWTVASQNILKTSNEKLGNNIIAKNFNFFEPDRDIKIPRNSAVYTVAALEQVGENFKTFVDYLIEQSPDICIHFEPIDELLDSSNLLDSLSIHYFRKRNYLKGFLPYLEKLESEGKIEILKKQRIYSGSYFIEGHSLIMWRAK